MGKSLRTIRGFSGTLADPWVEAKFCPWFDVTRRPRVQSFPYGPNPSSYGARATQELRRPDGGRRCRLGRPAREIVGLVGANGAGKTTTVECVQGLRKPDGGTLRVLSFDPVTQSLAGAGPACSQLQSSALPDRLRVGETVRLFSGRAGDELIEQFGLAERRRGRFRRH